MLRKQKFNFLPSFILSLIPFAVSAQPSIDHVVVAPSCLLKNREANYQTLSTTKNLKLIKVNDEGIKQLIDAKTMYQREACGGFIDVTEAWNKSQALHSFNVKSFLTIYEHPLTSSFKFKINNDVKYHTQVNQLFSQMNAEDMWADLTILTSKYKNRNAYTSTGADVANWLVSQVKTMVNSNRTDVSITTIATGFMYSQPSVVVKIGESNEPGVVIGAHMDAVPGFFSDRPGADDDGSGTVTVLEVARVLLTSNMKFKKPIYLVWYAAEEEGLVGSQHVVADFQDKNIPVQAVMQLDMVGYANKNDPTVWLLTDNVNAELNTYLKKLINEYVKRPIGETTCGYGCSDHASWSDKGYAASAPFESSFKTMNPDYHKATDTMEKLSLAHMADYAKLATAFAVELAGPVE